MSIVITYIIAAIILVLVTTYVFVMDRSFLYLGVSGLFITSLLLMAWNGSSMQILDEDEMLRSGVLSVSIVIVVSLISSMAGNFSGNHGTMALLIFLSLLSVLLTVPDFYFGRDWTPLTRHLRIAAQILAVSFVALCVVMFFHNKTSVGWTAPKDHGSSITINSSDRQKIASILRHEGFVEIPEPPADFSSIGITSTEAALGSRGQR